ncbi:MAG: TVP38/TMEM64 family protein [Oscillospiraceae bacterium]
MKTGTERKHLTKTDKIRIIAIVLFLIIAAAITAAAIPYCRLLATEDGLAKAKEKVLETGALGPVIYMLLVVVQIIIAFIPGGPVEILGGVLFGTAGGTVLCMLGFLLGTSAVYSMVKKVGKPLVSAFVSEDRFEKFKFLKKEKNLELIIFIMFLIPGIPKDALTYFVPLTPINGKKFCILATLARFPATISSVMIGSSLQSRNLTMGIIAFVITAVLGIVGILYNNRKKAAATSEAAPAEKQTAAENSAYSAEDSTDIHDI